MGPDLRVRPALRMEMLLRSVDSTFLERGQPDHDRDFRHPRVRADKSARRDSTKVRRENLDAVAGLSNGSGDEWDKMPPLTEVVDGINRFTQYYFQLGFIPKVHFPQQLVEDRQSVSLFLVVSILSISARLSPSLSTRYGNGMEASQFFMDQGALMARDEVYQSSLENCQAFYLLSIAQQGSGLKIESHINMGIALRMATTLQLHLEETYNIENPTPSTIIRGESARRTLWMLHSQDQLHSGTHSPISLSASDITTLLPCDEDDFDNGRIPSSRAALGGTPPAISDPGLVLDPNRSLFASLLQAHNFWGIITRRAVKFTSSRYPWNSESKFASVVRDLDQWESNLPRNHQWCSFMLKEHKARGQDLAYFGVTMIPRLCNIVLRRPYLIDILTVSPAYKQRPEVFNKIAGELFSNVHDLYEQIEAQFTGRSPDQRVGAQMAAFFCPDPNITRDGPLMFQRTLAILMECKDIWPLASRWVDALNRFAQDPTMSFTSESGMAYGRDSIFNSTIDFHTATPASSVTSPSSSTYGQQGNSLDTHSTTLQPSSPHDISASLSAPHVLASHFPSPHIQQAQMHQLQVPHLQHQHHQLLQQPSPPVLPQHQTYISHQLQSQIYMDSNNMTNLDMVIGGFDPNIIPGYPIASQSHPPVTASIATPTPVPHVSLNPPADGYEAELNLYSYGPEEWASTSNIFDGYN
ncbi:general repressor of transcription [Fusarium heterosporum]|uniref:General repressor of transcription n=1 Tax=Fusarium heterosporum TaxID=42747 RepID=A0A8H5WS64_FUSHE|nr:general repressor of transcription [Fusarium heterosporum]